MKTQCEFYIRDAKNICKLPRVIRYALFSLSLLAMLGQLACSAAGPTVKVELRDPPPPLPVAISVSPGSAQVQETAWLQFNATVSNASDKSVTWQVDGVSGGDGTNGTITTLGRYFAPNTLPTNVDITIKAISNADTSKAATANVTLFARHRVAVRTVNGAGQFYDAISGAPFLPRGNNYIRLATQTWLDGSLRYYHSTFNVGSYDSARSDQALAAMQAVGYNVVRVFINGCCRDVSIGNDNGGLNMSYVTNLADFINRAKSHDIQVVLASDSIPDFGSYATLLNQDYSATFAGYNAHYLTSGGIHAAQNFWHDLVQALVAQHAAMDAIFAYEIRQELFFESNQPPFTLNSLVTTGNGKSYDMSDSVARQLMMDDNLTYWTDQTRIAIRAVDPSALVTVGFFAPQSPNPYRIGDTRLTNPYPAMANSTVDFVDLHIYRVTNALTLPQFLENFGVLPYLQKPIVLGEFGSLTSQFDTTVNASAALVDWQVQTCQSGFNGWMFWTWDLTDSDQIGDPFWWATAGDGSIGNNLSPSVRSDPCSY